MKKYFSYILVVLLAAVLYAVYLFSTSITFFLSAVILSVITYYILNLNSERQIGKLEIANPNLDYENARNKRHILITLPLLLLIFIAALITEKRVMMPSGNAYFKNIDYSGLNHYAISFKNSGTFLYNDYDDSLSSKVTFSRAGSQYNIQTENFNEPVFQKISKDCYRVINAGQDFEISKAVITNGASTLKFSRKKISNKEDEFTVHITSTDAEILRQLGKNECNSTITFKTRPIRYGISLNNLFTGIENYHVSSAGDYEVLNAILDDAGSTYLLCNSRSQDDREYILFKTGDIGDYKIIANNKIQTNSGDFSIEPGKKFYIGFANNRAEMYLDTLQNEHALYFDFPNTYYMSSPNDIEEGTKCTRFITNQYERLKDIPLKEGFCFQNSSLADNSPIHGVIEYVAGSPRQKLQVNYIDKNESILKYKKAEGNKFSLVNNAHNLRYHFSIRDFSENGFAYGKTISYTLFIFLLFAAFTVFSNAGSLRRFQPIVLFVIFAFVVLRFILYWRIATFPPLENISKHELENTFRGFDFNILGISVPVPATVIFTFAIIAGVFFYRIFKKSFSNKSISSFNFFSKRNLSYTLQMLFSYLIMLGLCMILSFVPIEFVKRVSIILLPTLLYIFYSKKCNENYVFRHIDEKYQSTFLDRVRAYIFYLIQNPAFYLTVVTIAFFAITDRGFCVLFILFILLKNVLLNFLKKSIGKTSVITMFTRPWNYWIYGLVALLVYFIFIAQKSLFYYLLTYKLVFIGLMIFFVALIINLFSESKKIFRMGSLILLGIYLLAVSIPQSRKLINQKITEKIKHVQYRASIIHQPVSALLEQNEYSSFSARKIIETAENQWFINSYISNPFDYSKPINFKSFTKVGVNYNTQTRDVVVARFIIGELGSVNMYLILVLCLLPLIFYLVSYKLKKQDGVFETGTYAGLIPLLLFFTLCLFVWLTSTNRFVFFGQDFPFLSLTSKISVLLPLLLFFVLLIQNPATYNFLSIKTELAFSRYIILFGLIFITSAFTVIKNELNQDNFNVVVNSTRNTIEQKFDNILGIVQDSLDLHRRKASYEQLCKIIKTDKRYIQLVNQDIAEPYTKSIFSLWEQNPSSANRVNNPMYIRYDQGRYRAEYNNTLYLTLPIADNKKVWHGSISENSEGFAENISLRYNGNTGSVSLPYNRDDNNISFCIIPTAWMPDASQPAAIMNVHNQYKKSTNILLQKKDASTQVQSSLNFSKGFGCGDIVTVHAGNKKFDIVFNSDGINFANHKWVNSAYRAIFPMGKNNFWIYNLANALRTPFKNTPEKSLPVTLDYNLYEAIQVKIKRVYKTSSKNRKFNFSVVAADGDGNIRVMNDFNGMRTELDPNNPQRIYKLQQEHFFYSNTNRERKQWGNANLLSLHLGPGSSIKPAVIAAIGSQANLEWDKLIYLNSPGDIQSYAGLTITQGWKNIEHGGDRVSLPGYIEHSSNFFHSVVMFLGSYTKQDFLDKENKLSLVNVLTRKPNKKNTFPRMEIDGTVYALRNFSDKGWPYSDPSHKTRSYFANENSLIATGMSSNLNLATTDIDKQDGSPMNTGKVFFFDSITNNLLKQNNFTNSIWVLPEASSFPQKMRHYISSKRKNEINENFNLGLKTPTLGGYPYQLTPLKMLEMYNALFTQNMNYHAGIAIRASTFLPWQIDSSWVQGAFKDFLCHQVFEGMKRVITSGTGTKLMPLCREYGNLFFYAKTGTINEESSGAASSRRLILTITDKDMTIPENISPATKVYSLYYVIDNNKDFDWGLVMDIARDCIQSKTFKNYFAR